MVRTLIYFIFSLATIFYALPRLPLFSHELKAGLFSFVWLFFALTIVGAYLDHLLILDEEKRARLSKLKKYQLWKKQQDILRSQGKRVKSVR